MKAFNAGSLKQLASKLWHVCVCLFLVVCVCVYVKCVIYFVLFPPPSLPEDTLLSQDRQIQYPIPNRHPDACLCVGRGKDAVRQVVVGEVMVGGDGKKAFLVVGRRHDLLRMMPSDDDG